MVWEIVWFRKAMNCETFPNNQLQNGIPARIKMIVGRQYWHEARIFWSNQITMRLHCSFKFYFLLFETWIHVLCLVNWIVETFWADPTGNIVESKNIWNHKNEKIEIPLEVKCRRFQDGGPQNQTHIFRFVHKRGAHAARQCGNPLDRNPPPPFPLHHFQERGKLRIQYHSHPSGKPNWNWFQKYLKVADDFSTRLIVTELLMAYLNLEFTSDTVKSKSSFWPAGTLVGLRVEGSISSKTGTVTANPWLGWY